MKKHFQPNENKHTAADHRGETSQDDVAIIHIAKKIHTTKKHTNDVIKPRKEKNE
jgi:hypothetical protein